MFPKASQFLPCGPWRVGGPRRLGLILAVSVLAVLVFAAGPWTEQASGQKVRAYRDLRPELVCYRTAYGSEVTVHLRGAPPRALVWLAFSLCEEGTDIAFEENLVLAPEGFDLDNVWWTGQADHRGRLILSRDDIPAEWSGRTLRIDALVQDRDQPKRMFRLLRCVRLDHPGLYLPLRSPTGEGIIDRYDEIAGRVTARIEPLGGIPRKIVFSRDSRQGYVLLEDDRIVRFDNLSHRIVDERPTGQGLTDLALTPDGNYIIVLTRGVHSPSSYLSAQGGLWIYDAETLAFIHRIVVDPVAPEVTDGYSPVAAGGWLSVSEDSTLVFIRHEGLTVGVYNLLSGRYRPVRLGGIELMGGRIRDIAARGDGLLALVTQKGADTSFAGPSDRFALVQVNMQNYEQRVRFLGRDPMGMRFGTTAGGRAAAFMLDRADETKDLLWCVELFSDAEPLELALPEGILDFDVGRFIDGINDTGIVDGNRFAEGTRGENGDGVADLENLSSRKPPSLGIALSGPGAGTSGISRLCFLDLDSFRLLPGFIEVYKAAEGRIHLSRSLVNPLGYVLSRDGGLSLIDLKSRRVVGRLELEGEHLGRVVEVY